MDYVADDAAAVAAVEWKYFLIINNYDVVRASCIAYMWLCDEWHVNDKDI